MLKEMAHVMYMCVCVITQIASSICGARPQQVVTVLGSAAEFQPSCSLNSHSFKPSHGRQPNVRDPGASAAPSLPQNSGHPPGPPCAHSFAG